MTGLEEKVALEAFKPTTGFLNALLSPKIEKVKIWAEEKELKGKLDPNSLSRILESYLTKLAKRVAEVTTISFPLQKLNISEAYEPLYLQPIETGKDGNKCTVDSLLHSGKKSFLIIDNAGMGKSTFSKYLVTQVLFKSERIPLFFELRKVNQELELIENLAKELDELGIQFSRELFYELVKRGKFILILDGFDEVDVDYQEKLSNQIYDLSLKGGKNTLLLTSRPQEALPDLVDSITYKFSQFTKEQAISLVSRYDSVSKLDVGRRLITQLNTVPDRFLETPLLVSLLYRTFGTNNSIADRICTFYDEIYQALYKGHDLMNKNGYIRQKKSKLDFEEFRRLLRALCYYMSISNKTSFESYSEFISYIDKAVKMSSVTPESSALFLDDLLVAVPLMQREGCEYKFLHKTILEFFAAEYIIYKPDSVELVNKIMNSKIFPSFNKIFEFVYDISPTLFESVITKHHAETMMSMDSNGNIKQALLNSLIYLKEAKFGLWEVELYSKDLRRYTKGRKSKQERKVFAGKREADDHENGYFTRNWTEVSIDGIEYYLAFSCKDTNSKLHHLAWEQISETLDLTDLKDNDIHLISELIAKNKWTKMTVELANELYRSDVFVAEALNSLLHNRAIFDNVELRVFSSSKTTVLLNKLNTESAVDEEFDDLLL